MNRSRILTADDNADWYVAGSSSTGDYLYLCQPELGRYFPDAIGHHQVKVTVSNKPRPDGLPCVMLECYGHEHIKVNGTLVPVDPSLMDFIDGAGYGWVEEHTS